MALTESLKPSIGSCLAQQTSGPPTPGANDTEALQKAAQNPVASMISVPLQNNSNFGIGSFDRIQNVLNIQPVIPVRLSENWNLIVRWIIPIVWQPAPGTANLGIVSAAKLDNQLEMADAAIRQTDAD